MLGGANLRGTVLEESSLKRHRPVAAKLIRAALGKADLSGSLLEEADLRGASLRFADLTDAVADQADFRGADLWSAKLTQGAFVGADFRAAVLREADLRGADLSGVDFRRAELSKADFRGAKLDGADLRGAKIDGANFDDTHLSDARLERLDLSRCSIARIHLDGAYLDRTRPAPRPARRPDRRGGRGGLRPGRAELSGPGAELHPAGRLRLVELGLSPPPPHAKARRPRLRRLRVARRPLSSGGRGGGQVRQRPGVEWLCDYGESIMRVLATMAVVYLGFAALYGATGSVLRTEETPSGPRQVPTTHPLDLAIFSLLAMTTSGSPAVGLMPANEMVHLLTGVQASLGIALTGLLGFVLGNRVRR